MFYYVRTVSEVDDPTKIWLRKGELVAANLAQPYNSPSSAKTAIRMAREKAVKHGEMPLEFVFMRDRNGPESDWFRVEDFPGKRTEANIAMIDNDRRVIFFDGEWEVVKVLKKAPSLQEALEAAQ